MIEKLRTNFKLSNILSKVFFVLAYCFANWKSAAATLTAFIGYVEWGQIIFTTAIAAGISALVAHFVPVLFLRVTRLASVTASEYSLLATVFWGAYYLLVGVLNLLNLLSPVIIPWGAVIFPTIASLLCGLGFYAVTSKLYFNDVTRVYYFKVLGFAIVVLTLLAGGAL